MGKSKKLNRIPKNKISIDYKKLPLQSIVPTPGNPQVMKKRTFDGMVKAMRLRGWLLDPPVVWERPDGKYQTISGHHRIKAGIKAGITETTCKILTGLTVDQADRLVAEANTRKGNLDGGLLNIFIEKIVMETGSGKEAVFEDIGLFFDIGKNSMGELWKGMPEFDQDKKDGWCTVQFNAFLQKKTSTQLMKGGNTEVFYSKEGTYPKSEM